MSENEANYLSAGIKIVGTITFTNDMIIDGYVEGEITSKTGSVTIGEGAQVKGDIGAQKVTVMGTVEGKIVSNTCSLKSNATLLGDLETKTLSMEEGAKLKGSSAIG